MARQTSNYTTMQTSFLHPSPLSETFTFLHKPILTAQTLKQLTKQKIKFNIKKILKDSVTNWKP